MNKPCLLVEFDRSIGSFIYNGSYLTGIKIRSGFWELHQALASEVTWELLINIPRDKFVFLWPKAEQLFSSIHYAHKTDLMTEVPGYSLHSFIDPSEWSADFLLSSRSEQFKLYAQVLNPESVEKYLTCPAYFPECYTYPEAWEKDMFSSQELDEHFEYAREQEKTWVMQVYETINQVRQNGMDLEAQS